MTDGSTGSDLDRRIRDRAYRTWLEEGQSEGRYLDHWLRAKREVEEEERVIKGTEELAMGIPRVAQPNRE